MATNFGQNDARQQPGAPAMGTAPTNPGVHGVYDPSGTEGQRFQQNVEFVTDVQGQDYGFMKFNPQSHQLGGELFPGYNTFYDQSVQPKEGDMVAADDGYLYALAGEATQAENGEAPAHGWYRSTRPFHGGPAPNPS